MAHLVSGSRRILYHYRSLQIDTGSPRSLLELIGLLDRTRYQPYFLASGDGPLVKEMREREVEIVPGNAESLSMSRPWLMLPRLRQQYRLLKSWRIDLVHLNQFGWNTDIALAAWLAGIPVVLHIHNPVTVHWQNLNRFAADLVLTVSRAQVATVKGFHRIRRKHRVLYNAVDLGRFASGTRIRDQLGLQSDDVVALTIAQVSRRKGIDLVLEVARTLVARYPRLRFLVAGPDAVQEQDYAQQVRAAAAVGELEGRVKFLGSRQDIPDLLASSDVMLFPTRAEPFGIAVVEAMAAGVPVIASRVGGVPEIIDSEEIGTLVEPDDLGGFIAAVSRVAADPDAARQMGQRAAASLAGRFDPVTLGDQLNDCYATLLGDRSPG